MADANQQPPAAEKAAEATTPHAAGSTEAPAEKTADAPANETVAAASTEKKADDAKDEEATTTTAAAAPDAAAPQADEPATTTTATTTTTGDEKAALDKETGPGNAKHPATVNSSASSVVAPAPAAADTKDGEKSATSKDATSAPAAATTTTAEPSSPSAPAATAKTPLDELDAKLPAILEEVGHDEMWGVTLVPTTPEASSSPSRHVPTAIVLQKFLNANDGDPAAAEAQLRGALEFRKKTRPLGLLRDKAFSAHKFADLGAVTVYPSTAGGGGVPEVFTWNLYGNVKGKMDEVFVPLEEYAAPVPPLFPPKLRKKKRKWLTRTQPPSPSSFPDRFMNYRIALQELGIQQLNLAAATEPITADRDPYKITQVHDYKSISFLRQNPNVKAASTAVIKQFALAYPELLKVRVVWFLTSHPPPPFPSPP